MIRFESSYRKLLNKAELEKEAKDRLDALHQTMNSFNVVGNRTLVAETLLRADDLMGEGSRIYLNREDKRVGFILKMVEKFKALQGKRSLAEE
jgi:hypothetical protein